MSGNEPIAHVAEDGWGHGLEEHLRGAAGFAAEFGYGGWGRLVGVWHETKRGIIQ